ncbi:MAG TPA: sugar phosphate isomerase/epimerase family protein [Rhodothermales bacterium]|nr:sugar phosphate isomerase/epimerase family protein [Rhodothermales bacterium]
MTFPSHITCAYLYVITRYGYPPAAADTLRHLDEMAALGFRSVELEGIREAHLGAMYDQREAIAAHVERLGLEVPYFCVVLPGLSSPDGAERERNLALFEQGCEVAARLGSLGVLDNAPLPPYVFPGDVPIVRHYHEDVLMAATLPPDLDWARYWQDLTTTYRAACDVAARYGLSYQMHPAMGVLAATTDAYLLFHDAVGRDNLRFNLDTANLYVLKDNLALALRRLAGRIDYIHLSDNRGQHVEHLPPGEGAIRWDVFFETLDAIGFTGRFGLDIGGAETLLDDLDRAYTDAARWLLDRWPAPVSA